MPVLRQKRTVTNAPIGVARINTGESELWETIRANAKNVASTAFNTLKKESLNEAQELALSQNIDKVKTINPATGKLEALELYNMNSDARAAYKRIIDSRFEKSISDEIKLKSKEFALIENISPQEYEEKFSQYLAGVVNNAPEGMYKGMVEEAGTFYLASTKMNLTQTRRQEQKAKNKQFLITEVNEVQKSFSELGDEDREIAYNKILEKIDLNITADSNSYSGSEINALKNSTEKSYWLAALQSDISSKPFKTQKDLNRYIKNLARNRIIFGTEEFDLGLPPEYLNEELANYARSQSSIYQIRIQEEQAEIFKNVQEKLNAKDISIDNILEELVFGEQTKKEIELLGVQNKSERIEAGLEYFTDQLKSRSDALKKYIQENPEAELSVLDKKLGNEAEMLLTYALSLGLDTNEQISTAVGRHGSNPQDENGDFLSPESQAIIKAIHELVPTNRLSALSDYVKRGYSDTFITAQAAKAKLAKEQLIKKQEINFRNRVENETTKIKTKNISYTQQDYDNFMDEFYEQVDYFISQGKPLGVDKIIKLQTELNKNFIIRDVNSIMSEMPNISSQILYDSDAYILSSGRNTSLLRKYEFGERPSGSPDGPTMVPINNLKDRLDDILSRTLGANHKAISTAFGELAAGQVKEEARIAKITEAQITKFKIESGEGDISDRSDVSKIYIDWTDDRNWENIISKTGHDEITKQTNLMMSGVDVGPNTINSLFQLYNQYSNLRTDKGATYNRLTAYNVFTNDQSAFFETVSDLSLMLGSDKRNEIIQSLSALSNGDKAERRANFFATAGIKDKTTRNDSNDIISSTSKYIRKVLPTPDLMLSTGLYKQFEAYVNYQIYSNMNEKTIEKNLKNMYEKVFVKDDIILDLRTGSNKTNLNFHNIFGDSDAVFWITNQIENQLNEFGYTISPDKIFADKTSKDFNETINLPYAEQVKLLANQRKAGTGHQKVVLIPDEFSNEGSLNFWPHVRNEDGSLVPVQGKKDGELMMPYFNTDELRIEYSKSGFEDKMKQKRKEAEALLDVNRKKEKETIINSTLSLNNAKAVFRKNQRESMVVPPPIGNIVKGEVVAKSVIESIDFKNKDHITRGYVGLDSNQRGYLFVSKAGNNSGKPILLNQKREQIKGTELTNLKETLRENMKQFKPKDSVYPKKYKELSKFYDLIDKVHRAELGLSN